ncbi:MAG TPA: FAD-dependent oxidoreductase [Actinomycetota bacterium]|nr:FAD-dependent oxidoreductase [Actinomycetota bacterium]
MAGEAVVVGGGVVGVSCARFLAEAGFRVVLLERGELGRGCSYANAGFIVPSHSQPLPAPGAVAEALRHLPRPDSPFAVRPRPDLLPFLLRMRRACTREAAERGYDAMAALGRASLDLFDALAAEAGSPYRRSDLLQVYLTAAGLRRAEEEAEAIAARGFRVRVLSGGEARELEPALSPEVRGALLVEDQAVGDCFAFVRSLAEGLARRGVRVLPGRPVRRVLVRGGAVRGVVASGPEEEFAADLVVLAAGAWTPALARPLGIRLPLEPAKGYSCTVEPAPAGPRLPVLAEELRVAITPLDGRLRVGGTLELAGFEERLDARRYGAVLRSAARVLREPPDLRRGEAWYGFRPLTADGLPVIGPAPGVDGLILATGHGTLGFTQAPATGKVVAELAGGERPSVPIEAFRPDRF